MLSVGRGLCWRLETVCMLWLRLPTLMYVTKVCHAWAQADSTAAKHFVK